jgi:hypothetical protein
MDDEKPKPGPLTAAQLAKFEAMMRLDWVLPGELDAVAAAIPSYPHPRTTGRLLSGPGFGSLEQELEQEYASLRARSAVRSSQQQDNEDFARRMREKREVALGMSRRQRFFVCCVQRPAQGLAVLAPIDLRNRVQRDLAHSFALEHVRIVHGGVLCAVSNAVVSIQRHRVPKAWFGFAQ